MDDKSKQTFLDKLKSIPDDKYLGTAIILAEKGGAGPAGMVITAFTDAPRDVRIKFAEMLLRKETGDD